MRAQKRKRRIEDKVRRASGQLRTLAKQSLSWFFAQIKMSVSDFPANTFKAAKHPFIGGMFHYIYDAKHKNTLPYWDKFPLVIPVEAYRDGFLGLNLHYLPPIMRARLLDTLMDLREDSPTNGAYMRVSYQILKDVVKYKLFAPCIKRYLSGHIRSNLVVVDSDGWEEVAFLPTQQFTGATHQEVWRDAKA